MQAMGFVLIFAAIVLGVLAIRGGYKFLPPFAKVSLPLTATQAGQQAGQSVQASIQNVLNSAINPPTIGPH